MTRIAWVGAVVAAMVLGTAGFAVAQDKKLSVDDALKETAAYKFGQSRVALTAVEDAVRDSQKSPEQRKALAGKLAGMLAQAEISRDAKDFVCRQLSLIGGDEQVPALAALLADKDLSNLARYALERMPGEAPSAALRDALGKSEGLIKVGIINTLGERRDMKSGMAIAALLGEKDPQVASAAAAALGKIGCENCCKALGEAKAKLQANDPLQIPVTNAFLQCADAMLASGKKEEAAAVYAKMYVPAEPRRVRIAALQGLVNARGPGACPLVLEALKGDDRQMQACAARHVAAMPAEEIKKVGEQLESFAAPVQVLLIEAMASTGSQEVLPPVRKAAESATPEVQVAALAALGKVGCPKCVPLLAKAAAVDGPAADAARASLSMMRGKEVDDAIIAAAKDAEPKTKVQLIKALGSRRAAGATPALLAMTADADKAVCSEAATALAAVADEKALGEIVNLMLASKDAALRETLEKAYASAAQRCKDDAAKSGPVLARMKDASPEVKVSLVTLLSRIGDEVSLKQLQEAAKDANADVQSAAIRGLANNWPEANGMPVLLDLAQNAKELPHKVLALRGYVRLVQANAAKPDEKVKMLEPALAAAARPEEKTLVLGTLGQQKTKPALAILVKHLDSPETANAAAAGIISMAGDKRFKGGAAKEFAAAKAKILEVVKDKRILDQAKGL